MTTEIVAGKGWKIKLPTGSFISLVTEKGKIDVQSLNGATKVLIGGSLAITDFGGKVKDMNGGKRLYGTNAQIKLGESFHIENITKNSK